MVDLSGLEETIVQLDLKNGPSLDTLLEEHKQKLMKRAEGNGYPRFMFYPADGYQCLDCGSSTVVRMSQEKFQWHTLTM